MVALRTRPTRHVFASRAGLALFAVLTLSAPAALARHHHGHADGGADEQDDRDETADASTRAAPGAMPAGEDEADEADDDAGAPVVVDRTPAQVEHRDTLVATERALVRSRVHRDGGRISPRERQAIGLHWRHVMRLLRIRELAEHDHDTSVVTGVDALIERADKKFKARMDELDGPGANGKDGGVR